MDRIGRLRERVSRVVIDALQLLRYPFAMREKYIKIPVCLFTSDTKYERECTSWETLIVETNSFPLAPTLPQIARTLSKTFPRILLGK